MKIKLNAKAIQKKCESATDKLRVGQVYFLSSFYDKEGAFVKVIEKSKTQNFGGWNSSVTVEVLDNLGFNERVYPVGSIHSVNATNLYEKREMASHSAKYQNL